MSLVFFICLMYHFIFYGRVLEENDVFAFKISLDHHPVNIFVTYISGHSVVIPVNSSQHTVQHHSMLNPRLSAPPEVASKSLAHSTLTGPPPISANPPGPNLMGHHPRSSGPQQLVNNKPTVGSSQLGCTKSNTYIQNCSTSTTQPQSGTNSGTPALVGVKTYSPEDTRPSVISGSNREPVKTTSTAKSNTISTNKKPVAPSQPTTLQTVRSTPVSGQTAPTVTNPTKKSPPIDTKTMTPSPTACKSGSNQMI